MARPLVRRKARVILLATALVGSVASPAQAGKVHGQANCGSATATCTTTTGAPVNTWQVSTPWTKYRFLRWDYDGTIWNDVDNPISIIFVSKSDDVVGRVYSDVESVSSVSMTGEGAFINEVGYGPNFDGDDVGQWHSSAAGRKTSPGCHGSCVSTDDVHMRVYGNDETIFWPATTQVYNGPGYTYPYYAVASVHIDRNDFDNAPGPSQFGWQSQARDWVLSRMYASHRWTNVGSVFISNKCAAWFDPDHQHYCYHDGFAEVVAIDGPY